jgi:hypothetical protein
MPKAAVLPVPVIELARISFPLKTAGIHCYWMAVGAENWSSLTDFIIGLIKLKSCQVLVKLFG